MVLKTKQVSSSDALINVRNQGFEHFHLTYRARALRGVRKVTALFPYYLIVRIDDRKHDWKVLSYTKGVSSVVGRVLDADVEYFRSVTEQTDDGVYRYTDLAQEPPRFNPGDPVEAMRGLFADKHGEYVGRVANSDRRVRVLFSLLGREATFEVNAVDLVKAA